MLGSDPAYVTRQFAMVLDMRLRHIGIRLYTPGTNGRRGDSSKRNALPRGCERHTVTELTGARHLAVFNTCLSVTVSEITQPSAADNLSRDVMVWCADECSKTQHIEPPSVFLGSVL